MDKIRLTDTIYTSFTLSNSGGSAMSADALPSAVIYENASSSPMGYAPTITPVNELGTYLVELVITTGNGFTLEKSYNCIVEAVVDGVSGKSPIINMYIVNNYAENISGYSTINKADVSGQVNNSLSAYETTGVASKIDIIINATNPSAIASAVSGSIVSGIGEWGDLRWSKIYGIPLAQWDVVIGSVVK